MRKSRYDQQFELSRPLQPRNARALLLAAAMIACVGHGVQAQDSPLRPPGPQPRPADPTPAPPPPPARAQEPVSDGEMFPVRRFEVRYATDHTGRPLIEELRDLHVELGRPEPGLFIAPRTGERIVRVRIGDLVFAEGPAPLFSVGAINAIGMRIVQELNSRGIVGVLVAPDPDQIQQVDLDEFEDLRDPSDLGLTLEVWTRSVDEIRTLGAGARWSRAEAGGNRPSAANRINHPVHDHIRRNSPLVPTPGDEPGEALRKDRLDDYLFRLNRHPGRRVDAAIASSERPGEVVLDYIVTENRPWTVYAQVSNTGTKQTSEWRQRAGFVHTQLTNCDDILSIDFITASFDQANAVIASYERPIFHPRLRARVYGSWSEFTASDVGFADQQFVGKSWTAGGELIGGVYQHRRLFIDVFGGARWENHNIRNEAVQIEGEEPFFFAYTGFRVEQTGLLASTSASARVEASLPDVAGTDETAVDRLGRLFVDDDWFVLKWDVSHQFYIEPLLLGDAWADPATPEHRATMAHEIAVSLRGQHAFNSRLIPQQQETVGGLYTVRGYPESLVAGDDVLVGTVEYRFHLPRVFAIQDDPSQTTLFGRPFRYSRDQRFGRPDWDLIFRGFFDFGRVTNSKRQTFESDETLLGAGVGAELIVGRNLDIRVDWGFALRGARDVDSGDNRVHFVATVLF